MFAALAAQGAQAPDIVFPDGGPDSYWHNRADGRWASYVLDDIIPRALALLHADPRRIAIGGISMGGFGALDLARIVPSRFCAVGGHSAALWQSAGETASGAFDDAEDYARHEMAFARAHRVRMHVWAGWHDWDYRSADLADYLRFYVRSCR
jgi:S-formylglutathione hydrolase FrmB